jgi:hypothetical protein
MQSGLPCPGPGCERDLKRGQKACSPRCRAALWRRAKGARDRALLEHAEALVRLLKNPVA